VSITGINPHLYSRPTYAIIFGGPDGVNDRNNLIPIGGDISPTRGVAARDMLLTSSLHKINTQYARKQIPYSRCKRQLSRVVDTPTNLALCDITVDKKVSWCSDTDSQSYWVPRTVYWQIIKPVSVTSWIVDERLVRTIRFNGQSLWTHGKLNPLKRETQTLESTNYQSHLLLTTLQFAPAYDI